MIPASSSERGVDYFCADCNGRLRRRKSHRGTYHFVHQTKECPSGGLETIVHLLSKSVIENEKEIWIPDCLANYNILCPIVDNDGTATLIEIDSEQAKNFQKNMPKFNSKGLFSIYYSNEEGVGVSNGLIHTLSLKIPFGIKKIQSVRVEESLGIIRPDIIINIDGVEYLVEIANTHFVDSEKLQKIYTIDMPTIEINVSHIQDISYEALKRKITKPNDSSYWLHYSNELKVEFEQQKKQFERTHINKKRTDFKQKEQRRIEHQYQKKEAKKRQQKIKEEIEIQNQKANKANDIERNQGLPVLQGTAKQIFYAINARRERIRIFGKDDLLVKRVQDAGKWVNCKSENQLQYPRPFCMASVFEFYDKKDEQLKAKEVNRKISNKILRPTVSVNDINTERAKGIVIFCPKCKSRSYEFKELVPNSYYARICSQCKHSKKL